MKNKYQEALDNVMKDNPKAKLTISDIHKDIRLLLELVLKETPKKPITIKPIGTGVMDYPTYRIKCPTCNHQLPMKKNCINKKPPILYCDRCGQKLDWSE